MTVDTAALLVQEIGNCRLCAGRFAGTATAHQPRPVAWFRPDVRILVAGQAPGRRVHDAGIPFLDRSGDRLRDWMGISKETFYDRNLVAIVPTAFCWPGYDARGADLAPPPLCWETWHRRVLDEIGPVPLRLMVGGHAIRRHLGRSDRLSEIVANWQQFVPGVFPLPHPSWRNNAWLRANPWFETDLLPDLRAAVAAALA